ncbi:MAG TPA: polysaccharide biosynthesis/export family protein [Candidatus Limnocylindrales bacterium]|nr:polysaccharide biosynthesis/export family protein [Candidatus Limnocylindrales bacterium]
MTCIRRCNDAIVLVAAAVSLFGAPAVQAQTQKGARASTQPNQQAEPYRVGVGDVIRVDVAGRTDVSGSFTVADDGTVTLPIVGSVRVQGRSAPEIRSDLSRRVSLFDRSSPPVTVTVAEYKSRKIFVLGAVLLPGIYAFAEMPTIWDAIAEAGGPLDDANLSAVEMIPGDASGGRHTQNIDVAGAIRESRTDMLPRLKPGDTVRVPRGQSSNSVLLMGAITRPGPLPYDQAPDLVTAVVRSGGPTTDAKLSEVQVLRQSGTRVMRLRVDLDRYFEKGDLAGNPRLEPGDTVFLPRESGRRSNALTYVGAATAVIGLISSVVILANRH